MGNEQNLQFEFLLRRVCLDWLKFRLQNGKQSDYRVRNENENQRGEDCVMKIWGAGNGFIGDAL